MNFKIIETATELPNVLLYIDELENDEGTLWDCVIVQAIGQTPEDPDKIVFERIDFPDREMCRHFIKDYSKESAEAFCTERDIFIEHPNHKEEEEGK